MSNDDKIIRDITKIFCTSIITLNTALVGPSLVNSSRNLHYLKQQEIEYHTLKDVQVDFKKEVEKLGLEDAIINLNFCEEKNCLSDIAYVTFERNEDLREYDVFLGKGRHRFGLYHELYHIYLFENDKANLVLSFIDEWDCTSYAIQRLKEERNIQ